MINNVKNLSLAYFFSENKTYSHKVQELLQVWFVDKATRMNPNLNYAQGIPGKNDGRGFGIIEFSGISHIITAVEIMRLENQLEKDVENSLKKWMSDYLIWLQTSEFGIFEKTRKNNHGTLYDVQEVSLLLFFDRMEEAKVVLKAAIQNRIESQIEADGSQPDELKRTKSLTYSILNLSGLAKLAFLGRKDGIQIDIWEYESDMGDLQKAYDFLYPYLNRENSWPYEQLGSMNKAIERLRRLYVTTGSLLSLPSYCKIISELKETDDLQQLLYPCLP